MGSGFKSDNKQTEQLADELHKPVIRKFEKKKNMLIIKDNIWVADLEDMHLIIKFDKVIGFKVILMFLVHMLGLFF